jgi:hypothetical protein
VQGELETRVWVARRKPLPAPAEAARTVEA